MKTLTIFCAFIVLLVLGFVPNGRALLLNFRSQLSSVQSTNAFTFTAAGDYNGSSRTDLVLQGLAPSNSSAEFNVALGDLSYGSKGSEIGWCDYVKSYVGENYPFELLSGNHEDDGPNGNNIDNFATCLPDRIGGVTGRYTREYYFDYPVNAPLARFIMISPKLTFLDEGTYYYTIGTSHYDWVSQAIDSARQVGIRWIVVGMHKNCITVGRKSCSIGKDLFNLLINKKVDLILQGHDHTYQRSKQLALNDITCPSVIPGIYNDSCVIDDGSDGVYTKDSGSVVAIVATGGAGLYDVVTTDTEAPYFASIMGNNLSPSWGFLKVNISYTGLSAQFVPELGTFNDSFSILDMEAQTPTPSQTATLTPVLSLTPTETAISTLTQVASSTLTQAVTSTITATGTFIPTETATITPTPTVTSTPTPTSQPPSSFLTFIPVEDATILSKRATKNFGTTTSLTVDNNPPTDFMIKFNITGVSGRQVLSAKLRLYNINNSNVGGIFNSVGNDWNESTVNYENAPSSISMIDTLDKVRAGNWYEVDLSGYILGDGTYSLRVSSSSTNGADYASRENTDFAPLLILTLY